MAADKAIRASLGAATALLVWSALERAQGRSSEPLVASQNVQMLAYYLYIAITSPLALLLLVICLASLAYRSSTAQPSTPPGARPHAARRRPYEQEGESRLGGRGRGAPGGRSRRDSLSSCASHSIQVDCEHHDWEARSAAESTATTTATAGSSVLALGASVSRRLFATTQQKLGGVPAAARPPLPPRPSVPGIAVPPNSPTHERVVRRWPSRRGYSDGGAADGGDAASEAGGTASALHAGTSDVSDTLSDTSSIGRRRRFPHLPKVAVELHLPFYRLSLGTPGAGAGRWQPRMARIVSGQDLSGLASGLYGGRPAWLTFCCERDPSAPVEDGAVACLGCDAPASASDEKLAKEVVGDAQLLQFGALLGESASQEVLMRRGLPPPVGAPDSLFGLPDVPLGRWDCLLPETDVSNARLGMWRLSLRNKWYIYKTRTVIADADAVAFRCFYFNDQHKARWDKNYTALHFLPDATLDGHRETAVLYARCDVLVSSREYIYARRVWSRADGGCYAVLRSCSHVPVPPRRGTTRVEDYVSGVLIRALPGGAVELTVTYFECAPPPAPDFLVKKTMRRVTENTVNAFRAFQKAGGAAAAASAGGSGAASAGGAASAAPPTELAQRRARYQRQLAAMLEAAASTLRGLDFGAAARQVLAAAVPVGKLAASYALAGAQAAGSGAYRAACHLAQDVRVARSWLVTAVTFVASLARAVEWGVASRIARSPHAAAALLTLYNTCTLLAYGLRQVLALLAARCERLVFGAPSPLQPSAPPPEPPVGPQPSIAAVQQALAAHAYNGSPALQQAMGAEAAALYPQLLACSGMAASAAGPSAAPYPPQTAAPPPSAALHCPACQHQLHVLPTTPATPPRALPPADAAAAAADATPGGSPGASWAAARSCTAGASPSMACSEGLSVPGTQQQQRHRLHMSGIAWSGDDAGSPGRSPADADAGAGHLAAVARRLDGWQRDADAGAAPTVVATAMAAAAAEVAAAAAPLRSASPASSCAATALSSLPFFRASLDSSRPDGASPSAAGGGMAARQLSASRLECAPQALPLALAAGPRPLARPVSCPALSRAALAAADAAPRARGSLAPAAHPWQPQAAPLAWAGAPPALAKPLPAADPAAADTAPDACEHEPSVCTPEQRAALATYVTVSGQLFALHASELTQQRLGRFLSDSAAAAVVAAAPRGGTDGSAGGSQGDGGSGGGTSHSQRSAPASKNGWQRWDYSRNYSRVSSSSGTCMGTSQGPRGGGRGGGASGAGGSARRGAAMGRPADPRKFMLRLVKAAGARVASSLLSAVARPPTQQPADD